MVTRAHGPNGNGNHHTVALAPKEVAARLGVTHSTVLKLIKDGKLKAARIGWVWRIRESDLDSLFED